MVGGKQKVSPVKEKKNGQEDRTPPYSQCFYWPQRPFDQAPVPGRSSRPYGRERSRVPTPIPNSCRLFGQLEVLT